jgi:alpha-amylase
MSRDLIDTAVSDDVANGNRAGTEATVGPTGATLVETGAAAGGEPVALQYFDYDDSVGPDGDHWERISREAELIARSGYDAVWVQPPMEPNTENSNGYNPRDHLTWDSPLGSEADFERMVDALGDARHGEVGVYIDAIVNHTATDDPGDGTYAHLDDPEYYHHPHEGGRTTMQLFDLWDLDQTHEMVGRHLRAYVEKIAQMGCAGVRWDAAKHVPMWFFEEYLNEWVDQHDLFRVGEVFDGDVDFLEAYVDTGMNCFDYPLFFTMHDALREGGDMRWLQGVIEHGDCLLGRDSYHASTFVANHDEGPPQLQQLAYAFILTAPGYPIVYSNHANEEGVDYAAPWLQNLVWIKRTLASGEYYIRHADRDLFVHERHENLLTGINKADAPRSEWVYTGWEDETLTDYTGQMETITTDDEGWVELTVPAKGWACYAPE